MPELPEVETIRRGLLDCIVGKTIKTVVISSDKSFIGTPDYALGRKVLGLDRRGKMLIIELTGDMFLTVHLRMTGQLIYVASSKRFAGGHPTESLEGPLPDRHTRVTIAFTDRSKLFFNDQRKFGFVQILNRKGLDTLPFLQKLGPEPLEDSLTLDNFIKRFSRKKTSNIKAALLDQSTVAGVGNIYADEALFLAQIHPETPVGALKKKDFDRILTSIRAVMTASINSGGSTMHTYRKSDGTKGDYLTKFAKVFRNEGKPCPICGTKIIKTRVAGRGTHLCPTCQPLRHAKNK